MISSELTGIFAFFGVLPSTTDVAALFLFDPRSMLAGRGFKAVYRKADESHKMMSIQLII